MFNQCFQEKEVSDVDTLPGTLDGASFNIFCMKEPEYTMMLMSTYGFLNEDEEGATAHQWRSPNGEVTSKQFIYWEPFFNHFHYRHAVDDHNGKRHSPISLEETWGTKWWPNCIFSFLVAVTEVNAKLIMEYFAQDPSKKTSQCLPFDKP